MSTRTPTIQSPSTNLLELDRRCAKICAELFRKGAVISLHVHDEFRVEIGKVSPDDIHEVRALLKELRDIQALVKNPESAR